MKKNLIVLSFLFSFSAFAQPPLEINEEGKIHFEEIHSVNGASVPELYLLAKKWFVKTFKSADNVIELDDKELGMIMGKANSTIYVRSLMGTDSAPIKMWYTISIAMKEGRYKAVVDVYKYQSKNDYGAYVDIPLKTIYVDRYYKRNGKVRPGAASYTVKTKEHANQLLSSIKEGMSEKIDNDW